MPASSSSEPASIRLPGRILLALVSLLSVSLLIGCAEVTEPDSAHEAVSWSTEKDPTPTEAPTADKATDDNAADDKAADDTGDGNDDDSGENGEVGRAGGSTPGTALAMLDELAVKGRAPKTGYDADLFEWRSDADHNGCDTRNDVLRRDLQNITLKAGTKGCVVIAGDLADEYKGQTYAFDRDPNNIDIDHIVARSNAWQTGAAKFDEDTLREFGNDPLNLLAVSSSLNRQKGDGDAATWLPPNPSYRCEYVSRQIAIKHKYRLWVVQAEKTAMERVLADCDDQSAFTSGVSWPGPGRGDNVKTATDSNKKTSSAKTADPKKSETNHSGSKTSGSGGSTPFENCTAAREAGAGPVHRGDPGYGSHLDRDGDGVGCE